MSPSASLSCAECHAIIRETDRWCPNCGTPIAGVALAPDTPIPYGDAAGSFSWDAVQRQLRDITLGQYEILTELGRGGMAAVFLAHEYALNRKVALKVMSPAIMLTDGMVDRFHAEARTQANLTHANIVSVYSVRREEDLQYFVMQYVPGRSVQEVLRAENDAGRSLSLAVVRSLLYQIGSALTYAHRHGVIHRDVKPANVMLNAEGDGVVTDFGIAKVMSSSSHTVTGTVVGTAPYMSPEQCYAAPLTPASDQYSLGVVAYELLVGHPPFTGTSFAVMQAHTMESPRPIAPQRPDCPPELEAAIMTMLTKDKQHRFPDIDEALHALGAQPAPSSRNNPVRQELIRLADAAGVAMSLGEVLKVPVSPTPQTRSRTPRPGSVRRTTDPAAHAAVDDEKRKDALGAPDTRQTPEIPAPETVARIEPSAVPALVGVGESFTLRARLFNQGGRELKGRQVQWTSSAPHVATVTAAGALRGVAPGHATIEARVEERMAAIPVTVDIVPIARLEVRGMPRRLKPGVSKQLSAVAVDADGRTRALPIEWSSTDPAILSVDRAGTITAVSVGPATLRVRAGTMERALALDVPEHVPLIRRLGGPRTLLAAGFVAVLASVLVVSSRDRSDEKPALAVEKAPPSPPAKDTVLRLEIESLPASLRVGEQATGRLQAFRGLDLIPAPADAQWRSSAPHIVQVNAVTGAIRALRAGVATLSVSIATTATVSHTVTVQRVEMVQVPTGSRAVIPDSSHALQSVSPRSVVDGVRPTPDQAGIDSVVTPTPPPTFEASARREIQRVEEVLRVRNRAAAQSMFGDAETDRIWRSSEGRAEIVVSAGVTETSRSDNTAHFFLVLRDRRTNDTLLSGEYRVRFDESSGVLKVFEIERLQR